MLSHIINVWLVLTILSIGLSISAGGRLARAGKFKSEVDHSDK